VSVTANTEVSHPSTFLTVLLFNSHNNNTTYMTTGLKVRAPPIEIPFASQTIVNYSLSAYWVGFMGEAWSRAGLRNMSSEMAGRPQPSLYFQTVDRV